MRLSLLLAGLACFAATSAAAPPRPLTIVAHRGLAEGVPENTVAAFRQSLQRGLTTNGSFQLSWPGIGILEHAPAVTGPWQALTGLSPWGADIIPGQNEFFRVRVIAD